MSKIISALFTGIIVVSIWAVFSINKPVRKDVKDIIQGCNFGVGMTLRSILGEPQSKNDRENFNNIIIVICTEAEIRLGDINE